MGSRRSRNRRLNLEEGRGGGDGGRGKETECLILWLAVLELLVGGWWWHAGSLTICQTCLPGPPSG